MNYYVAQQISKKLNLGSSVSSNTKTQDNDDATLFHYSDDFSKENGVSTNNEWSLQKLKAQIAEENGRNWDVFEENRGRNYRIDFDEITEKSNESQFSEQDSEQELNFGQKKVPFIFEEDLPPNLNFLFQPHLQSNAGRNNLNSVVMLDNLHSVANFKAKKEITNQLNWCIQSVNGLKKAAMQAKRFTSKDIRDFKTESQKRADFFRSLLSTSCRKSSLSHK